MSLVADERSVSGFYEPQGPIPRQKDTARIVELFRQSAMEIQSAHCDRLAAPTVVVLSREQNRRILNEVRGPESCGAA
jgi:hypothetical protein